MHNVLLNLKYQKLNKLFKFFKQCYRLQLSQTKKELAVWKDIKKFFNSTGFNVGVHEKKKYVELHFRTEEKATLSFYVQTNDEFLNYNATIISPYPQGITEDLFILSAHFNNLFRYGTVIVDVNAKEVEYVVKIDLHNILLNPEKIELFFQMHYNSSEDVLHAFNRLIQEGEAPAIIIADLLKERENRS